MPIKRKTHTPDFKVKVALDAIRSLKTASELASQYQIHPVQIAQWKKQAIEGLPEVFQRGKPKKAKSENELTSPLYEEIGRLKMELDWLKKNLPSSGKDRRMVIETQSAAISIRRQCQFLGVSRSGLYSELKGESEENLAFMRLIDEQYLRTPFFGSRQMTHWLRRQGYDIHRKRVQRLMQRMSIQATVPGPHTSKPHPQYPIYPYLLKGLTLQHANQPKIELRRLSRFIPRHQATVLWGRCAVLDRP